VRDYANQSAKLTAYRQLTESYRSIYEHEKSFADPRMHGCDVRTRQQGRRLAG